MPLAAATSTIGLTTPKTVGQRPYILWIAGIDRIGVARLESYRMSHNAATEPATFQFVLDDPASSLGSSTLQIGDSVTWVETAPNSGAGRILFNGFIKRITPQLEGRVYADWQVDCADISEVLDYAKPIINEIRPSETDLTRLQYLVGNFALLTMTTGAAIASTATLSAAQLQKMTLRQAIEATLTAAGSGRNYYVDTLGQLHTYSGLEGVNAPYNITDTNPNLTTTIPAEIESVIEGANYVDQVYVIGGNAAGSGIVAGSAAPLPQRRVAYIDAPSSLDSNTAFNIGQGELAKRQTITRCRATVSEFDGWALGQTITVTEVPLGWAARQFQITALSMRVLTGTGKREYVLELGPSGAIGKQSSLSQRFAAADANAQLARAAGLVPGMTSEGQTITPTGYTSGLAILDGVSDVFKIIASGTISGAGSNANIVSYSVTLTTNLNYVQLVMAWIDMFPITAVHSGLPLPFRNSAGDAWWVEATQVGTTQAKITVSMESLNNKSGSTFTWRYYLLQEVAV